MPSTIPLRTPTQYFRRGFQPLPDQTSYPDMDRDGAIPLSDVRMDGGRLGIPVGNIGGGKSNTFQANGEKQGTYSRAPAGRRRVKTSGSRRVDSEGEEVSVNKMGQLYNKIVSFSPIVRYLVYILPIGAIIAIPVIVGATVARNAKIGGVRIVWFFTWIETVWLSVWAAKVVAMLIPTVFMFLCGVVSSGTRKYATLIRNLEVPITLVLWAATSLVTFQVLATTAPGNDNPVQDWVNIMRNILGPCLIAAGIYLGEKLIIQLISVSYHQRSFAGKILESKRAVFLLGLLYDASRTLFPMYCPEFEEEDLLIEDSIEAMLLSKRAHRRSGSVTPMRLIGNIGRFGDKVTSAFGNMASEIAGRQVFNPTSAHSVVVEALEKKRSSEALAKRIWMSFVVEGKEALYPDDLQEVLGPARHDEAEEAFTAIDMDGNGDISLDEMVMRVIDISRDRKAMANSMRDVGQAINVLDQVLATIVFIIVVFIFVAFLNANFVTTLATAGTTLLSLSFVFAVTTQEFLGSCIFLFVKHPYDVGDRVHISGPSGDSLVVEQISLLYTVFKRIDTMCLVQIPNIILNGLWVENVTRSRAMREQLEMFISFDTSLEDIELLRKEMEFFVNDPDNSRDFQNDVVLECTGIGNMDKLQLKVEIRHKSNWSNETIRAARRSKFMCALVLALRKVPIYGPGGGTLPLGDPGNPAYSVAVSDSFAVTSRDEASQKKEGKRLVPSKTVTTINDTGDKAAANKAKSSLGTISENEAATSLNSRNPGDDAGRDNMKTTTTGYEDSLSRENSLRGTSLDRVRSNEIETLRQGLLKRESTKGRRKPGNKMPPLQIGTSNPGMSLTMPSPRPRDDFDEEAGIDGGSYNGYGYSGAYEQQEAARGQTQGLAHMQSAPAAPQANSMHNRI